MALSLSSARAALAHIERAEHVAFGTYVLRPDGPAQRALLNAAHKKHGHVVVTLQRDPYNAPEATPLNVASARALRRAGAHVRLLELDHTAFHLKAAVCDGVAYLDNRNWPKHGPQIIVADDAPRDVALLRASLTGHPAGSSRALALRKDVALARETALVRRAGGAPVIVESENIGASPLAGALQKHAAHGARTVLILGRWRHHTAAESALIEKLKKAGVDVRETGTNAKMALAGNHVWIGSANATGAHDERTSGQADWGVVTGVKALVNAVKAALRSDGARDAIEPPR